MNQTKKLLLAFTATFLITSPAFAHHEAGGASRGLLAGIEHPLFGMDHLLAMLAVGLLSPQVGMRRWWLLPLTFVATMLCGGMIGMFGITLVSVESLIALSVLVLGVAIASGKRIPVRASIIAVGAFGLVHGHAHGTELPAMSNTYAYVAGFVMTTIALHLTGVLVAAYLSKHKAMALRASGAIIAFSGAFFLLSA